MILEELTSKIKNGSCRLFVYDNNGLILVRTIWYNTISEDVMKRTINKITVEDYELKVELL